MNKHAAQGIVYRLTAWSLRRLARAPKWPSMPDLPVNLTDAERAKVAKEMLQLAERLEGKFPEAPAVDGEAASEPDPT